MPKVWISGQRGEGLRDIYNYVRKGATRVIKRITDTLGGPRNGPSPSVRSWLEKYGDLEIESITVCKKPIVSMIDRIGDWVSGGKIRENMEQLGYDKLMHLWMIVRLKGGQSFRLEKNGVIEVKQSSDMGNQSMIATPGGVAGSGSTASSRFEAAQKAHGDDLWRYHLVNANCQKFVLWFIGNPSPEVRKFVEQDVGAVLKDMGLLQKIATGVTDLGGVVDVAVNGRGAGPSKTPFFTPENHGRFCYAGDVQAILKNGGVPEMIPCEKAPGFDALKKIN